MATIYRHDGASRYLGLPFRDLTEAEVEGMRPLHKRIVRTSGAWTLESDDVTVAQLRDRAKALNLTGTSSMRKAELEAAIAEAEQAAATGNTESQTEDAFTGENESSEGESNGETEG